MSRSGYSDDCDGWSIIRWRGQVASAIKGKRGQRLLIDLYQALEAMPEKKLITGSLETTDGEVCALGALGKVRGIDMKANAPESEDECGDDDKWEGLGDLFGAADQLTREIMYMNDEWLDNVTPEERYEKMKAWVLKRILPVPVENEVTL